MEAAAELGRTLLERNRELESTVRQQQAVIDDQTQEMEVTKLSFTFLKKPVGRTFSFPAQLPFQNPPNVNCSDYAKGKLRSCDGKPSRKFVAHVSLKRKCLGWCRTVENFRQIVAGGWPNGFFTVMLMKDECIAAKCQFSLLFYSIFQSIWANRIDCCDKRPNLGCVSASSWKRPWPKASGPRPVSATRSKRNVNDTSRNYQHFD